MFGRHGNLFVKNPWKGIQTFLRDADVLFFNLETVISPMPISENQRLPKTFNYQSNGTQLKVLRNFFGKKPIVVSMINNHTLDYGTKGLIATKRFLLNQNFLTTWSRYNPIVIKTSGLGIRRSKNIYFYSATDHPEMWEHEIWVVSIKNNSQRQFILQNMKRKIDKIKNEDPKALIVFSIHWGPNYIKSVVPFYMEKFGRGLIDAGVDIVFGHSAHHVPPKSYEFYKHGLIIYGLGDFVNDYQIYPLFKSDQALMALVDTEATSIDFIPVRRVFVEEKNHSSIPFTSF